MMKPFHKRMLTGLAAGAFALLLGASPASANHTPQSIQGTITVAGNYGSVYTSTDGGHSWKYSSVETHDWTDMTATENGVVMVGNRGTNVGGQVGHSFSSADGLTWTKGSLIFSPIYGVASNGTTHVATGGVTFSYLGVSSYGYTAQGSGDFKQTLMGYMSLRDQSYRTGTYIGHGKSATYGDGKFLMLGQSFYYAYATLSTDGNTWSSPTSFNGIMNDVTYGNGKFVAVGETDHSSDYAQINVSTDGKSWSSKLPRFNNYGANLKGVAYGNGRYVAVGTGHQSKAIVYSSTDAQTWSVVNSYSIPNLWSITFDEKSGLFLAVGDGIVATSPDGAVWTRTPSQPNAQLRAVAVFNGSAAAVDKAKDALKDLEDIIDGGLNDQDDIDRAEDALKEVEDLIDALPPGPARDELEEQLDELREQIENAQKLLDARNAVERLEQAVLDLTSPELIEQADLLYEEAQRLVDLLPAGPAKAELQERIDAAKLQIDIAKATDAVEQAEASLLQGDADAALALVQLLPDGQLKSDLLARLDLVQKVIDILADLANLPPANLAACGSADALNDLEQRIDALPEGNAYDAMLREKLAAAQDKFVSDLLALLEQKNSGKSGDLCSASLDFLVKHAIEQTGAATAQDRGLVHGYLQPLLKNGATGKELNDLLDLYLP